MIYIYFYWSIILFNSLFNIGAFSKQQFNNCEVVDSAKVAIKIKRVIVAAERTAEYFPLLTDKKIALVVNQTSTIGNTHLVDSLVSRGFTITTIFAPEHGFRGTADAGEHIQNGVDVKTKLPIISLYGNHKAPTEQDLKNVDIILFDVQDVGVRFYTYLSTLHYIMQSAAKYNVPVIVLDRPNPNGHYIDGPILQKAFSSFVGMHPVPVVHGMTVAEYAQMINGENWLTTTQLDEVQCNLTVIPCYNYSHQTPYILPIKPSPNLPNNLSIYLYPSLCWFEGTPVSLGRGTVKPFQCFGHPSFKKKYKYDFMPVSMPGAKNPPLINVACYGMDLSNINPDILINTNQIDLSYLINAYKNYPIKTKFFSPFFASLAGSKLLQSQIQKGLSEKAIRASWQPGLEKYKLMRKKYLLYE
jgi:uncharacterized protein YbbC (DUF1343 family)